MIKNILRIIVGLIFIASGFVKAVDVVGFSFKLEEYFAPSVFNIPFLDLFSYLGILQAIQVLISFTLVSYLANQVIAYFRSA